MGARMAGDHLRRQRQMDDILIKSAMDNPMLAQDPDIQKALKKRATPEVADFIAHAGKVMSNFGAGLSPGSQAGAASPAQPLSGVQTAQAAPGVRPVAATSGGPSAPAMGGASGIPSSSAPQGQPSADLTAHIAEVDRKIAFLQQKRTEAAANPALKRQFGPHLDRLLGELQHQRDQFASERRHTEDKAQQERQFQQTKTQQAQQFKEAETGREEGRAALKETRDATLALTREGQQRDAEFKKWQQQHAAEQDAQKKEALAQQMAKNIDAQRDKLLADFAKLPDAAKPAAEARVKGYNTQASMFYRKHANSGAPTLLKFNAGKPGTGLRGYPTALGGYTGTATVEPTIEAVPPEYGSYKGKSGWIDADGNFYPETNAGTD